MTKFKDNFISLGRAMASYLGVKLSPFLPGSAVLPPPIIYGPRVYTDKNLGRHYGLRWRVVGRSIRKSDGATVIRMTPSGPRNSRYRPHQGEQEMERRRRQIAEGRLAAANGLSAS